MHSFLSGKPHHSLRHKIMINILQIEMSNLRNTFKHDILYLYFVLIIMQGILCSSNPTHTCVP